MVLGNMSRSWGQPLHKIKSPYDRSQTKSEEGDTFLTKPTILKLDVYSFKRQISPSIHATLKKKKKKKKKEKKAYIRDLLEVIQGEKRMFTASV